MRYKAIQKFQDKHGITIGYKLQDLETGSLIDATSDSIKRAIKSGQANIINLKITIDGKLIYSEEKQYCNKIDVKALLLKQKLLTGKDEYIYNGITYYAEDNLIKCKATDKNIVEAEILFGTDIIDECAFLDCEKLKDIRIPNSVISIEKDAFALCKSLISVVIPNGVKSIGSRVFGQCVSLTEIILPNSVDEIGNVAFGGCYKLADIELPSSIKCINERTFICCNSLKKIIIPRNIKMIHDRAFYNCVSLDEIQLLCSDIEFGESVFSGCENLCDESIDLLHYAGYNDTFECDGYYDD